MVSLGAPLTWPYSRCSQVQSSRNGNCTVVDFIVMQMTLSRDVLMQRRLPPCRAWQCVVLSCEAEREMRKEKRSENIRPVCPLLALSSSAALPAQTMAPATVTLQSRSGRVLTDSLPVALDAASVADLKAAVHKSCKELVFIASWATMHKHQQHKSLISSLHSPQVLSFSPAPDCR